MCSSTLTHTNACLCVIVCCCPCSKRLSKAFKLSGSPVPLRRPYDDTLGHDLFYYPISGGGGMKTIKPWPFPIFNWPGAFSGRCPNTSTLEQWYLNGKIMRGMLWNRCECGVVNWCLCVAVILPEHHHKRAMVLEWLGHACDVVNRCEWHVMNRCLCDVMILYEYHCKGAVMLEWLGNACGVVNRCLCVAVILCEHHYKGPIVSERSDEMMNV